MNLQIELPSLEQSILEIVKNSIPQQEYIGYADVNQFIKLSGISANDLELKVFPDAEFKKCIYRFGKGQKRYIEVKPAMECIKRILVREEML